MLRISISWRCLLWWALLDGSTWLSHNLLRCGLNCIMRIIFWSCGATSVEIMIYIMVYLPSQRQKGCCQIRLCHHRISQQCHCTLIAMTHCLLALGRGNCSNSFKELGMRLMSCINTEMSAKLTLSAMKCTVCCMQCRWIHLGSYLTFFSAILSIIVLLFDVLSSINTIIWHNGQCKLYHDKMATCPSLNPIACQCLPYSLCHDMLALQFMEIDEKFF